MPTSASGKPVTVNGIAITGPAAGNYNLLNTTATDAGRYHAAGPDRDGDRRSTKSMTRRTAATVTLSDNRVSGDVLTVAFTSATFADANVGVGKPVTVNGIGISGGAAGNYNLLNTSAPTTADITPRPTTTTLSSSLDVSLTPVRVSLTATVAGVPSGPNPAYGSVTFTDSVAGVLGTVNLVGSNVATLMTSSITARRSARRYGHLHPTANFGAVRRRQTTRQWQPSRPH